MAKREASRDPTTTASFICCFAMVYFSLLTTTHETSDEVKATAAAAAAAVAAVAEEYDHPGSFAVAITTDTSPSPPPNNGNLHPVTRIVQEKELGKAVIALAVAIAMATAVAGVDKLGQSEVTLILVLESVAIAAILNGILLKDTYVEFAKIVEAVGIILVAISFYAVVGLFLPAWALWVPAVCIGFILVPFAIAVWQPAPT